MHKSETVLTGAKHPGTDLEMMVSNAGFYLGYRDKDGTPYSRETQYFQDENQAQTVFKCLRAYRGNEYGHRGNFDPKLPDYDPTPDRKSVV